MRKTVLIITCLLLAEWNHRQLEENKTVVEVKKLPQNMTQESFADAMKKIVGKKNFYHFYDEDSNRGFLFCEDADGKNIVYFKFANAIYQYFNTFSSSKMDRNEQKQE